ncbi:MAG: NUDIX hydrolase [Rhizobium sp.]|nr:NUDIX hydrolase [Rhizobium sp.]
MSATESDALMGIPDGAGVFPVEGVRLRVLEGTHPYHLTNRQAAEANWQTEIAANPALFDGRMVFQHRLSLQDGVVEGEGYVVPYSTFLWWRRQPLGHGGFHVFAFPVIASADGALIAVEMAAHTANAGQVYCAAGSLDPHDIVDGYCDIGGNMMREVREETGLDLSQATTDKRFFASYARRRLTLLQLYRFDLPADAILERIAEHMEVDEEKEIARAVAIRSPDPAAHQYNSVMLPVLDWFFAQPR